MDLFQTALALTSLVTAVITLKARGAAADAATKKPQDFNTFQTSFLITYYIGVAADWLQGPYVYALYSSYGFSKHDIAVLFVGGFGASMIFGTIAGAIADKLGRKKACQLYCVLYIVSCATKHGKNYNVLMAGRVTGGIATSLLFSAFDSWLVCEHNTRGFDASLLSDTFSLMYFGNSLVAILSGVVAQAAADALPLTKAHGYWHYGGYCAPFDLSAAILVVDLVLITTTWRENYGSGGGDSITDDDSNAKKRGITLKAVAGDWRIWLLGTVVSLFEGSMFIFVFNWTPAFTSQVRSPPFGLIFATFMVACMGGSSLFGILSSRKVRSESTLTSIMCVAAIALATPLVTSNVVLIYAGFLLFEGCVGIYWPAIGTIKSRIVPEKMRATIYNIFRIPLNGVVLAILLNSLDVVTAFMWCSILLVVGFLAACVLMRSQRESVESSDGSDSLIDNASDADA